MADTQMTVATRKYDPLAPIGTASGLKSLLDAQKNSIATMLPKHITPERLFKTMLVAANRTPGILRCTTASILETINRAAELGLDLSGTLGEAYPVPFRNKVKDQNGREQVVEQCQLIIGYRGMEKLAWQTGEIASIDAEMVYSGDTFVFKKGSVVLVEWTPCMTGDPGQKIGAYCCVSLKSGGTLARFVTIAEIEAIRAKSMSGGSPAWRDHYDEMGRKCAIKRTLKDAPLSTEKFTRAMELDDDVRFDDVQEVETQPRGRARGLSERLTVKSTEAAAEETPATQDTQGQQQPPADQQQEADQGQADAGEQQAPPAEPPATTITDAQCETYESFHEAMTELAQAQGMPAPALSSLIGKLKVSAMPVAATTRRGVDARRAVLQTFADGQLGVDGKILK